MARETASALRALNDYLTAFTSVSFGAMSDKISFESDIFKPPTNTIWLEAFFILQDPQMLGAFVDAGNYREQGIYQINVCRVMNQGAVEQVAVGDELTSYFERGTILDSAGVAVNIIKSCVSSGFKDGQWYKVPVSVYFYFYSSYTE